MRNSHEYVHVTSSVVETIFIIAFESLSLIIAIRVTDVTGNVHPVCSLLLFFTKPWSINLLTHWGRDKMDAISQTTFSSAFSWMKMYEFRLKFHWSLFLRIQWTIFKHWFRWWLGAVQATSHYLNQRWLIYRRIYASLGLSELTSHLMNSSNMCYTLDPPERRNSKWREPPKSLWPQYSEAPMVNTCGLSAKRNYYEWAIFR